MAFNAGSVIVDIIASAESIRNTFKQAKESVNEFGSKINDVDKTAKGLGNTLGSSLSEPKSATGWIGTFVNMIKGANNSVTKDFNNMGNASKAAADKMTLAAEQAAKAQEDLARKVNDAQNSVTAAQGKVGAAQNTLASAQQSKQAAEIIAMEANKQKIVQQAETAHQQALAKSEQAENAAYLATLKHMSANSAASAVAKEEAMSRFQLAKASEEEARANLQAVRSASASTMPNTLTSSDTAMKQLQQAEANEMAAQSSLKNAKASLQQAQATKSSAQAALSATGSLASETAALNKNTNAKNTNAESSNRAKRADMDMIFAALGAQGMFYGYINVLDSMIKKGMEARNAMMGFESVIRSNGQNIDEAKQAFQEFKHDGLLSDADISNSIKNLTLTGYSVKESTELIKRFKDTAAFGKQEGLSYGQAVVKTTEGIRLGLSSLSDGAGMAKNLGQILKENGYTEQDLTRITTDAGVRQALYNGILKETAYAMGDASKMASDLQGSFARMKTSVNDLSSSSLNALSGVLNTCANAMTIVTKATKDFIDAHPKLFAVIVTVVTVLGTLLVAALSVAYAMPLLAKAFSFVGIAIKALFTPMGLLITAIILLAMIVILNWDQICGACSNLVDAWGEYFSSIWTYTKNFCKDVGDMMTGLAKVIDGALSIDSKKFDEGMAAIRAGWFNGVQEIHAAGRAYDKVVDKSIDVLINKLNPKDLFNTAWGKVSGIFDAVEIDMSDKESRDRQDYDPNGGKKKKGNKGAQGKSPYQEAMREYDHKVHMEELKEYEDKKKALIEIGETVEMTADEQMEYEEKVFDLVKAHAEDEKQYAREIMDYKIKTGEQTYTDKVALIDKELAAETDRHKKIQLMNDRLEAVKQEKQYESDLLDFQIQCGEKTLQSKLDYINQELANEKSKYERLKLLKQQFDAQSKMNEIQAQTDVDKIMNRKPKDDVSAGNLWTKNTTKGSVQSTIADLQKIVVKYNAMGDAGKQAADTARAAIAELQQTTQQWIDQFTDGLADMITQGKSFGEFWDNMCNEIANAWLKYQLNQLMSKSLGGLFGGMNFLFGNKTSAKKHDGGTISKFHTGGVVGGLEQDERVIVAQTGERVLNRKETKAFEKGKAMAGGGGGGATNQYFINTMDAASFREYAYKNKDIFGAATAADTMAGGAMAKAMRIKG